MRFIRFRPLGLFDKIVAFTILTVLLVILVLFVLVLPAYRESIFIQKKENIKNAAKTAHGILKYYYSSVQKGRISKVHAEKMAISIIKGIRYGKKNRQYIWINDFQPKMIVDPMNSKEEKPDWYRKNGLKDYVGPGGKKIFMEFIEKCRKDGRGFITHEWVYHGKEDEDTSKKITYLTTFHEWGWIIGTGIYIKDIKREILISVIKMIIILLIPLLIIIFMAYFFASDITVKLKKTLKFAQRVSVGNLTENVDISFGDELGGIAKAISSMMVELNKNILQIRDSTKDVNFISNELSDSSKNLSANTGQQGISLKRVSEEALNQSESVDFVTRNLSMLNNSIKSVHDMASKIKFESEGSFNQSRVAENGSQDAILAMNKIEESSFKIKTIINLIADIADQTNLLSLNASIEAARAGESGRGFAVVAKEISKLADKSATATKGIESLINETGKNVVNGAKMVKQLDTSIRQMKGASLRVSKFGDEMANVTEDQLQGGREIESEFNKIRRITTEIMVNVESLASVSQKNAVNTDAISRSSLDLAKAVDSMTHAINRFKIE